MLISERYKKRSRLKQRDMPKDFSGNMTVLDYDALSQR